ncbi:hypothetical protein TNCT_139711 [Trichonephila clavata]|uniref:C2H2-type domain-containing protein n=1 Tax=Trichonephila clavata TaxID=2740835 RepID=A0A8X6GK64_TRICU|nr:hypothetical protein TNCT_139711 [Trichonephila clavata]
MNWRYFRPISTCLPNGQRRPQWYRRPPVYECVAVPIYWLFYYDGPWNESSKIKQPIALLPWEVTLANLKEGLWNSAQDQKFRCKQCSAEFIAFSHYTAHLVHHKERHYDCAVCGKAFAKKAHLAQHAKMHTERNCICLECHKTFSQKSCLKRHMLSHINAERTRIKVEL